MDTSLAEHSLSNKENLPIPEVQKQDIGNLDDDQWESIRNLDEEENWCERTRVLSKTDHLQLLQCAKEILTDIVDSLPLEHERNQSGVSSISADDHNSHEVQLTDDDFKYSAAQFDVDYLESISTDVSEPSALARQSLYVKFDPLVGKDSPSVNRTIVHGSGSSDLLMLSTPPTSSVSMASDRTNISKKKQVHFGFSPLCETTNSDALISTETSASTSSEKASCSVERTLIDSSPRPHTSYSNEQAVHGTFTDYHSTEDSSMSDVTIPETDNLVKVLKYSEEDVVSMLEAARKEVRENERKKKDDEITALRHKIAVARREAKKLQHKDDSVKMSMTTHRTNTVNLETEIHKFRGIVDAHVKRETDTLDRHQEFLRDIGQIEEQRDLFRADISSLENIFDDLHKRYLKLKHVHQTLVEDKEQLEKRHSDLEMWNKRASDHVQKLNQNLQAKNEEVESTFEHMRKEHGAKLAVEKAKANQLQMQISSLHENLRQKEEEKQQVAQMCDELMKEL